MFDPKKILADFEKMCPNPIGEMVQAKTALDLKMDKFDIDRDYVNLGTYEFPIWGKRQISDFEFDGMMRMPIQYAPITYGGIARNYSTTPWWVASPRSMFQVTGVEIPEEPKTPPPPPIDHYGNLKGAIAKLTDVRPVKVEAPPAEQRSPDYVHTLTGWRAWSVDDGYLASVGTDFKWQPKFPLRASCEYKDHPAPEMDCSCGYWTFRTRGLLVEALKGYVHESAVIGPTAIWGRVIECENGYRSEYAYPNELWLLQGELEYLGHVYGVPVRRLT